MRRLIVGFLAGVGLLAILVLVGLGAIAWRLASTVLAGPTVPDRVVLRLDLRETLGEVPGPPRLALDRLRARPTVSDLVLGLDRAREDARVVGLLLVLDDTRHGLAVARELREAVLRVRSAGRFAIAWSDSYGELGAGNEGYYLASAADTVALQPVGQLGVTGLLIETPYARALLDRLGIEPVVSRRTEYKTAFEFATEREPTAAGRAMLQTLLESLSATMTAEIAQTRRLAPDVAAHLLGSGPYPAGEALALGLVDRVAFRDEIEAEALGRAGPGAELVDIERYLAQGAPDRDEPATVALIRAAGPVVRGSDELVTTIGADDLAASLAAAVNDPSIHGIILRLDTPGGSAVASETAAREIRRAVAAGKPVVVSMGNQAASGGYWIAKDASRIVAQPTTLTGSIGVVAGKPVLAGAWEALGIRWDQVARGENAALWSINTPFPEHGRARLERLVDTLYEEFKSGVARGRGLTLEEVEAVAKGRIWTGSQALDHRLVDRLGGLLEARDEVRTLLHLPSDAPLRIRKVPPDEPLWRAALKLVGRGAATAREVLSVVAGLTGLMTGTPLLPAVR